MYDDVLIPTDGSDAVDAALRHGLRIAENEGATVHGLYVVDKRITDAADPETRPDVEATLTDEGGAALEALSAAAERKGLPVVTEQRHGTPYKEILDYADEEAVDLVAIGSHGKSPREKLTSLGSVSERVVDGASIPVLVVRSEDAASADGD
ncbi:UspA domain-containing protein [Salinarchaeum sp. Harcht-Bsk1]|uniref:universal stress protein n=1 Tax=Salinarchaeum sp. Harcht-Bsk1 TaxID=1333523 RepID=UPI00034242C3|nr:universal stress protein [Salinarchaeum sp. Harcht-Bsk1]AGN01611.1 UspA domain-containing protein [Salinarchaeum sp. Harcht-Bsk1]